jgi:small conductance mechanosensitive channel
VMQAEIENFSYYPNRRVDIIIGVAYGTDLENARKILFDVAEKNNLIDSDPAPEVIITDFGASSIDITFMVWGATENVWNLKNRLKDEIYIAFDKEGIEIPFPQLTIHSK